jgi:uncharacterized protein YggU (UPF0235/DUF167 family)
MAGIRRPAAGVVPFTRRFCPACGQLPREEVPPAGGDVLGRLARVRIQLRVHPGSRRQRVEWVGTVLHVWVVAPAVDGAANAATVRAVAGWAGCPLSAVRLVAGRNGRTKLVEVEGLEPLPAPVP